MSKHTPGPWVVWAELNVRNYAGEPVAACGSQRAGDSEKSAMENRANASLIAAAPELLEACQLLISDDLTGEQFVARMEFAKSVIAKARGEA